MAALNYPALLILLSIVLAFGCQDGLVVAVKQIASSRSNAPWHEKHDWKAEDYFDDPKVVALCRAIEANDLKEMERLIKAGADVNARGKGNMTPLLWAYPDDHPERLLKLLQHGADPNVIFTSNFGVKGYSFKGTSVTHMAAGAHFPKYFDYVFDHGGDPNLMSMTAVRSNNTPIYNVIKGPSRNKERKVARLVELGADLNHVNGSELSPVETAVGWMGQFDIALQLLEAGADYRIYKPRSNRQFVHVVLMMERRLPEYPAAQQDDFQKLLAWLEENGVSIETARADLDRWSAPMLPGEHGKMMAQEVAQRKAKEQHGEAAE